MSCPCRCHVYGAGAYVSCNVGRPQPGGILSCATLHDDATTEPIPLDRACTLGHAEPAERFIGYACRRHYHWIDRTLAQIEDLLALLGDVIVPGPVGDGRGSTPDGSPAPGRIEIMVLTDRRNAGRNPPMTYERNWNGRTLESNGRDDALDVAGVLGGWLRIVVEERPLELDGFVTLTRIIRTLRNERQWIAQQEWLDLYCEELADVHRQVAMAVGDTMWPRPIGKCPNCQNALYPTVGVDEVTCRRCRSSWTGVALARLRLIHEQEGVKA